MIKVTIALEVDGRTRAEMIEREDLDVGVLAEIDDLLHEVRDHLERTARSRAEKRARSTP